MNALTFQNFVNRMNAKLDAYFGSHFIPFVLKDLAWGLSQIVMAILELLFWMLLVVPLFNVLRFCFWVIGCERWFKRAGHWLFFRHTSVTEKDVINGVIICPCCSKIIKRKETICPHCKSQIWRHEADSDL